ncbi:MAG: hypothetical protein E7273_10715 [Pseudobutyrivibrio ruminis]|nr:hypothetical protein [Pseudobutyrivibrio ruminis]
MIAYFPDIYEDELVYSIMCRLYLHLGIPSSCIAKKYIYGDMTARVDSYGIGHLQPYVMEALTKRIPEKELIINHTMFTYLTAFDSISNKQDEYSKAVRGENIYGRYGNMRLQLKYCPICAREDAIKYGEAYYHRKHQLTTACLKHMVKIKSIDISVGKRKLPALLPLENERDESCEQATEQDIKYSMYVSRFMSQRLSISNHMDYGMTNIISRFMKGGKKLAALYSDYESDSAEDNLKKARRNLFFFRTDTVLQAGYVLGIPERELFRLYEK